MLGLPVGDNIRCKLLLGLAVSVDRGVVEVFKRRVDLSSKGSS